MTPTAQTSKIANLRFEAGFTGNEKIFVKVEKTSNGSEKLVLYEKSGITAFLIDIFRDRRSTFTLREWASHKQGSQPQALNKERLTQNIKQIKEATEMTLPPTNEEAPLAVKVINQLVAGKNLDSDQRICSDKIKNALPPLMGGEINKQLKPSLEAILRSLGLNDHEVGLVMTGKGAEVDTKKIAAARSIVKAKNDANLEHAFNQLIQQTSNSRPIAVKALYLADFVQPNGHVGNLLGWDSSDAKSLAKFLLAFDTGPKADLVQHQRYINTLQLAIQKL
jgi:hypothetical protein